MDYSSKLALVVASTARKVHEYSARITEAAYSFHVLRFSVEHRAIQCGVAVSSAEIQLVGLAGGPPLSVVTIIPCSIGVILLMVLSASPRAISSWISYSVVLGAL